MKYPVSVSDLENIELEDDEQATLVVIEAILDSSLNELDFKDSLDADDVKQRVQKWEKYNEYVATINAEKCLFKGSIASGSGTELIDPSAAAQIAINASRSFKPEKHDSKSHSWMSISIAASILIIVLGAGFIVNKSLNNSDGTPSKINTASADSYASTSTGALQPESNSEKTASNTDSDQDFSDGDSLSSGGGGGISADSASPDSPTANEDKDVTSSLVIMGIIFAVMIAGLIGVMIVLRRAVRNSNN